MSDRHEMQAAGTHPAPCARHCESTAYEIELRRLRAEVTRLSSKLDHQRDESIETERMLRAELAASHHELEGAKKAARAQARIIESLQQQRAHLNAQRDQWIEARNTLESERAANATLTEELAASREREARMQWRPIETAPRDGTMVLLAGGLAAPSDWRIKVGYWASEDGAWYIFGGSWRPTRWMPLDGLYAALAEGAQG